MISKIKDVIQKLNKILPFSSVVAIFGSFFTLYSIIYVITVQYCNDYELKNILLLIELSSVFIAIMITSFILAVKTNNVRTRKKYQLCQDCVERKLKDSFHRSGLYHLSDLLVMEEKLASNRNPSECEVYIYTSDLATEKDADEITLKNIQAGVVYKIIYFNNTCNERETEDIKKKYGAHNLLDLDSREEYLGTFDKELADALGFDIIVYCLSNGTKKGYFAVDFVMLDQYGQCPFRPNHNPTCTERCNFGMESEPFYKELSDRMANELYKEFRHLFNRA